MAEQIYSKINAIMREVGAIGKNSKNTTQGFMFRGIDAVMNALNPALINNGVFVVPTILEQSREERTNAKGTTLIYSVCKVQYRFYAEDGSFVESVVIGEGMDTGDKATNKAMSIAFKYACFQVFCIPTEEMVDPDTECHTVQPKESEKASAERISKVNTVRKMILDMGWSEEETFHGRKIDQLNTDELTMAIKKIGEIWDKWKLKES